MLVIKGNGRPQSKRSWSMDTQTESTMNQPTRPARSRLRRRLLGGLAVLLAGGALSLSVAQAHGFGGGGGPDGMMFGGGGGGFMAFKVHRMLDRVGATDGQKAQIKAIWVGLRPQFKATHEQRAKLHQQITQAMTAPTIDPAAVEKLRQQSMQLMDRTSSVITQGLVETARVLTPEQRKQIAAEMQKDAEHRRAHFGEGGPDGL
jgi:protein CpxP